MPSAAQTDATYRWDRLRSPFYGLLESGWQAFALVVAIRYFEAPETVKSFIAGAGPIGFLLTPLTLYAAARLGARPSTACAFTFALSALLLGGAALAPGLALFAIFAVTSQMAAVQQGPLMLQVYSENYAAHERGKRLTVPMMLIAGSSIVFAFVGGEILDTDIALYRWIFGIMLVAAAVCALSVSRIPSRPLSTDHVGNPWQNLSLIWKDKFFGYLLGSWMLLGLGNLIALPIRYEYLANSRYGINADNTTIAVIMLVVPSVTRILSTKVWGHVFDKMHFVTTRNSLNLLFLFSISLFFFNKNIYVLGLAMAFQGLAMGGGKIFWSLWVTKIAPAERASSYMTVHMALTGLRGSMAPFLGYWIFVQAGPKSVAIAGLGLVVVAIILFERVRGHERLRSTA